MGCKSVRNPKRNHCLSDFRHFIKIIDAEIMPNDTSYDVNNDDVVLQQKAKVKTRSPFAMINGVSIDTGITHRFVIRYTKTVIEKNFKILFNGELYRIEGAVNENEDNLFWLIDASKRGLENIKANEA